MDTKSTKKSLGPTIVTISIVLMALGFLLLIQPFALVLYTIGFPVILIGVILINVGSHM